MKKCEGGAVFIPELEPCTDCSAMESRLSNLEGTVAYLQNDMTQVKSDIVDIRTALSGLSRRISAIETLIGNKTNTELSMTDSNNNEVTVTVLAE